MYFCLGFFFRSNIIIYFKNQVYCHIHNIFLCLDLHTGLEQPTVGTRG